MELTQGQISEIISNYISSSDGFVTLQSLIMNSLMAHERELFVKANKNKQCNGFRPRRWYCKGYTFVLRIPRSRSGNFYPETSAKVFYIQKLLLIINELYL